MIALFTEKMRRGEPLGVVSPGTQRRNFTFIGDVVDALMRIASDGYGDEFGIGHDRSYSVLEIAQYLAEKSKCLNNDGGTVSQPTW